MGANAQTAVPAFVAGEILTAEEMTQVNTGIPVFATTVTRDAAFGGSGEKVLAQGQYAYIEATSSLMVYSGSAWTSVGAGLNFIASVSLSGSAVTSGVVFTSAYENYLLLCNNLIMGTTDTVLFGQLDASGTPAATGYYSTEYRSQTLDGASAQASAGYVNANEMRLARFLNRRASFAATIFAPQLTQTSSWQTTTTTGTVTGGERPYSNIAGILDNSTSYNQIKFLASSGTITSGTVRIYGYATS